jgi:plastocyanin
MNLNSRILAVSALLALGALTGCGSSSSSSSSSQASAPAPSGASMPASTAAPASAATPSGAATAVQIANYSFKPGTLTVKAGTKVSFTNQDAAPHTATSNQSGAFDTGTLAKGQSKTVTLSKPGTYAFHCAFHAFMTGTITVT